MLFYNLEGAGTYERNVEFLLLVNQARRVW